jgi:hypothetical protein
MKRAEKFLSNFEKNFNANSGMKDTFCEKKEQFKKKTELDHEKKTLKKVERLNRQSILDGRRRTCNEEDLLLPKD